MHKNSRPTLAPLLLFVCACLCVIARRQAIRSRYAYESRTRIDRESVSAKNMPESAKTRAGKRAFPLPADLSAAAPAQVEAASEQSFSLYDFFVHLTSGPGNGQ